MTARLAPCTAWCPTSRPLTPAPCAHPARDLRNPCALTSGPAPEPIVECDSMIHLSIALHSSAFPFNPSFEPPQRTPRIQYSHLVLRQSP
jgi:hypothetical protein